MIPNIKLIAYFTVLACVVGLGVYIDILKSKVGKCEANTKIQKSKYERDIDSYEKAIANITVFYDEEITKIDNFERRTDETDCEAANRFFNSVSY